MDKFSNLLDISTLDLSCKEELFETLFSGKNTCIKRIISNGQTSEEWYDQTSDEFVVLLQGEASILYEDGKSVCLTKGDSLLIPSHRKHKVSHTSQNPPCIWLAVFIENI